MGREIEDQDLNELRDLENKNQELRDELAEITIREQNVKLQIEQLEQRLEDIRQRKKEVFSDVRETDQKGQELARKLRKKYGEGQFDLETGEFIEKTSEEG